MAKAARSRYFVQARLWCSWFQRVVGFDSVATPRRLRAEYRTCEEPGFVTNRRQ